MYSGTGVFSTICATPLLLKKWQDRLNDKYENDPTWPFRLKFIEVDVQSNLTLVEEASAFYFPANGPMPVRIDVILPPEDYLLPTVAPLAASAGIPVMSAVSAMNDQLQADNTRTYSTTFFVGPPPSMNWEVLNSGLNGLGIKTVAFISHTDDHNWSTCNGAAEQLFKSNSILLIDNQTLPDTVSASDYLKAFEHVRDNVQPDVLMVCGYEDCAFDWDMMEILESTKYFPKAVVVESCLQFIPTYDDARKARWLHVIGPDFVKPVLGGLDYIEDDTPYSSEFRPVPENLPQNLVELTNHIGVQYAPPGSMTSSTQVFSEWYANATGGAPLIYPTVFYWSAIDVLEAAMYKAVQANMRAGKGSTTAADILAQINGIQTPTPIGRVVFDSTGVNTALTNLLTQVTSDPNTIDIILPETLSQGAQILYPAPTWKERSYTQQYLKSSTEIAVVVAVSFLSLLHASIGASALYHRQQPLIRMLHYGHIMSANAAVVAVMLAFTLLWPMDASPAICAAQWWVTYVPLSYIISLTNMKAYRLSIFLNNQEMKPSSFSHDRVLIWSLVAPALTAVGIGIVQAVDPNSATAVVLDPVRPSSNYVVCASSGSLGSGLLIAGTILHICFSIRCVYLIRNGLEGFRDGPVIKEAFYILYTLLIITWAIQQLPTTNEVHYLCRTLLVCIGITLFQLRIMAERLVELWLPQKVRDNLYKLHGWYSRRLSSNVVSNITNFRSSDFASDSPVYAVHGPNMNDVKEMFAALASDPQRAEDFDMFVKKSLASESLLFCNSVTQYKASVNALLINALRNHALTGLTARALAISKEFIVQGSEHEVNISGAQRDAVIAEITSAAPPDGTSVNDLVTRVKKFGNVFDTSYEVVTQMLYQNFWLKFRASETSAAMMG